MYDTCQSKYISLSDLKQFVVDETPFEVRTAKTHKDITRQVLLQIISDEENAGTPLFTSNVLTRFIRMYGDSMQGEYSGYLEQISEFLEEQTEHFIKQLAQFSPADLDKRNMETWQETQKNMLYAAGVTSGKKD